MHLLHADEASDPRNDSAGAGFDQDLVPTPEHVLLEAFGCRRKWYPAPLKRNLTGGRSILV